MKEQFDREKCIKLLTEEQQRLISAGEVRFPKRADFSEEEVTAIKAYLGPWPRALEAAGLKVRTQDDHAERVRIKRINAKRKRTAQKKLRADKLHCRQKDETKKESEDII